MPSYRRVGDIPRKRHTLHRYDGDVLFEELMGTDGFSGPSSLLYHRRSPSALARIDGGPRNADCWHTNVPLRPMHIRTDGLTADGADAVQGRRMLLGNDDVELGFVVAQSTSP